MKIESAVSSDNYIEISLKLLHNSSKKNPEVEWSIATLGTGVLLTDSPTEYICSATHPRELTHPELSDTFKIKIHQGNVYWEFEEFDIEKFAYSPQGKISRNSTIVPESYAGYNQLQVSLILYYHVCQSQQINLQEPSEVISYLKENINSYRDLNEMTLKLNYYIE
jgi:hypothetical protein